MKKLQTLLISLILSIGLFAQVPDNPIVTLSVVGTELGLTAPFSLEDCFTEAGDTGFDPTYAKDGHWLSEFRNYVSAIYPPPTNYYFRREQLGGKTTTRAPLTAEMPNVGFGYAGSTELDRLISFNIPTIPPSATTVDITIHFSRATSTDQTGTAWYSLFYATASPSGMYGEAVMEVTPIQPFIVSMPANTPGKTTTTVQASTLRTKTSMFLAPVGMIEGSGYTRITTGYHSLDVEVIQRGSYYVPKIEFVFND